MDKQRTALVLIDLQKESKFGIDDIASITSRTQSLISACREEGMPVIYTRHINREDAVGLAGGEPVDDSGKPLYYASDSENKEVLDGIQPQEGDIVIDKYRWSGFYQTPLDIMLKSLNVDHLIIGGLVTDGCLMTTVFDGYFRDYNIHLVKDICNTSSEGAHMASLLIMANWVYGIKIYDAEEMMKKLKGQDHRVWESNRPDELPFTPETMRECFNQL